MFDNNVFLQGTCKNVSEGGKVIGFEMQTNITYYRAIPLSMMEYVHVSVDGEATEADQIPEEIRTYISDAIKSDEQGSAYTEWWNTYLDEADLQINPMPEDVPYNVDMSAAGSGSAGSAE